MNQRRRWMAVFAALLVIGAVEILSDTALDAALPFPYRIVLVFGTVVVVALVAAQGCFEKSGDKRDVGSIAEIIDSAQPGPSAGAGDVSSQPPAKSYGMPGSPEATTFLDTKYLPPPPPAFGGQINLNAYQSKTWWPPLSMRRYARPKKPRPKRWARSPPGCQACQAA